MSDAPYRPSLPSGIYAITDRSLRLDRGHEQVARAALDGGAAVVQLRDKSMATRELCELGCAISALCRAAGAIFIVNDRVDIALAVGADGVHLGDDDMPVPEARRLMGSRSIIGASADTVEQALAREREGAAYVGVGPVYGSATKTDAGAPIGVERIAQVAAAIEIPVVAIGGITEDNIAPVVAAGARMAAVISAIVCADDMVDATRRLDRRFQEASAVP